jgi:hypothetical protein
MRTAVQMEGRKEGRTDRQTDVTKLIDAFRNFANVPKNYTLYIDRSENLTSNVVCTVWCSVVLSD